MTTAMEYPDPRNSYRTPTSRCSYHRSNSFDALGDSSVFGQISQNYGYQRRASNPYISPTETGYPASDSTMNGYGYATTNGYAHSDYSNSDYGSEYSYDHDYNNSQHR